ncbi:MAG: tRNA (5-methylaminomethyl-2-thiouridylate)-methyltransferase [Gammaproteobacteria bacterium]|nr:tRNA (5-methylaminomethyl-2-thiouridylate)-methyltransferase [Gammaproteobacteria bacterium]
MNKQRRVLALMSGGLDSLLAAKVMLEQGLHVEGIHFIIGFAGDGASAQKIADMLGIKLHIVDVVAEFQALVAEPKHGYGAYLNPCLDCKIFMVNKALVWALEHDFDFVVTGEVVGQRPKSQRIDTMPVVANESGAEDLLLRPLCAKLLPLTKPEKEGWVEREKLYGISGRTRKPQIELARKFGFKDYPQPAGGCLLCDDKFCDRLQDLWKMSGNKDYTQDEIALLKVGRHLRPRAHFKMIIGRNESENDVLECYRKQYISLHPESHPGPAVLLVGDISDDDLKFAARIMGRFSSGRDAAEIIVKVIKPNGDETELVVEPMTSDDIDPDWYI